MFQVTDRGWRGIGVIPDSGWRLAEKYREFDAEYRFDVRDIDTEESSICRSGEVLQGLINRTSVLLSEGMHAAQPAGRNDGFQRGVGGVLPVSTSHPSTIL